MDVVASILITLVFFVLYFIPTLVAYKRKHHNRMAITVLNIIFGMSGIGWGIALVWALTRVDETS